MISRVPLGDQLVTKKRFRRSVRSNTSQGGLHHPTFEKYTIEVPRITKKLRREKSREQQNCTHKDSSTKTHFLLFILLAVEIFKLKEICCELF